jgi:hypothetical protein
VSGAAPGRNDTSYFDDYDQNVEDGDESHLPSVTPAKVAASILFNDSETETSSVPENGFNNDPYDAHATHHGANSELLNMALTFSDVGLDAGLSFGGDVGFDDGLGGFGGGADDIGFGGYGMQSPGNQNYGHQPFLESMSSSLSPDNGDSSDKKKAADAPATSKWFSSWGKK